MREINGGATTWASNYLDLLPDLPRYYCPVGIFICFFFFYTFMTEIWKCLRPPSRGKCRKVSFPRTQQKVLNRDHVNHNHGAREYSTTLPTSKHKS